MSRRTGCSDLRRQRGAALIEMLITVFVILLTTSVVLSLAVTAGRVSDRQARQFTLAANARTGLDEMLRELRASDQILIQRTLNGVVCATDSSNLVFEAPGYDPGSQRGILPGIFDLVAFQYNRAARTITQTTFVDTGSRRPQRAGLVIARNVERVVYAFEVREVFSAAGGVAAFPLSARALTSGGLPVAYVNGAATGSVYNALTKTVTLAAAPAAGALVQILYAVDPGDNNGAWLAFVNSVSITLTLSQPDGRSITRTITLGGAARLRNQRT